MHGHCIGVIDGKLITLAFARMVNGEDYYTKKGDHAIKGWSFVMILKGFHGSK